MASFTNLLKQFYKVEVINHLVADLIFAFSYDEIFDSKTLL